MNAYVLAGGASSRMGSDKARLPQAGWPMAVWTLTLLEAAGHRAHLVRRGPADPLPWVHPDGSEPRVLREADGGAPHPLWGVATALHHANGPVIVVPCDLPRLTVAVIEALDRPGVARGDRRHPLVAHVPFDLLEAVEAGARAGASVGKVFDALPSIAVEPSALGDRNTREAWSDPLEALREVVGAGWQRVLRGESARRRARGIVAPAL